MTMHLQREIETLKKKILALGAVVEESLSRAIRAIRDRDTSLAKAVMEGDLEIDRTEVEVEEECLKALALHQPVAIDLRFIVAVLKINSDLERIGDLATNIAERAIMLNSHPSIPSPFDLDAMADKAQWMVRRSLDALVNLDPELARRICAADDAVDDLNREAYDRVSDGIKTNLDAFGSLIQYLSISRHLERVADHATNIAEDVIYMIEGEIVRHRGETGPGPRTPSSSGAH